MKYVVRLPALLIAVLAVGVHSQPGVGVSASMTCPAATNLEALTRALDDAVSGPRDKDRTCLRELMVPEARLVPMRKEQDGAFAPRILTVDEWINAVRGHAGDPFYEKQIKVKSETYGHFAHLWSTYEIRLTPDGKAEATGINSIQTVFDGKRWRILSILWESNATAGPVPEKYLP